MNVITEVKNFASAYKGPQGFAWLVPGLLGGAPRPGIFHDLSADLAALVRVETKHLVTLTEEWEPDTRVIAEAGITSHYLSIPDMHVPSFEEARWIASIVERANQNGEAVVFHCLAGKGRTGTLLAAQLIWMGAGAESAIKETRARNPLWIESDVQLAWLADFEKALRPAG